MHNRRLPRLLMVAAIGLAPPLLIAALSFAQTPPPVPALPDTERRTQYSPSASVGPFNVGFALYGDSTDYGDWIEVWLNGVKLTAVTNWVLTSPTGTLATIPRPITDAQVTLLSAATGTIQIVGARRPRRATQLTENQGVSARNFNQTFTDQVAVTRETWDRYQRLLLAPPGESVGFMPAAATRAGQLLGFDGSGNPIVFAPGTVSPAAVTCGSQSFISTISGGGSASCTSIFAASGGGTTNFLRADGTWALPTGSVGGMTYPASPYVVGDFLYANTTLSMARLADVATGSILASGGVGVAPLWQTPATLGLASGPGSATAGHVATFADSTGKVLADGGSSFRTKLPTGVTNFYSNTSGVGCGGGGCLDTNDGLTPTTAKKTNLGAVYGVLNGYDFTCNVVAQSTVVINMLANEINAGQTLHFGPHDYPGACAGGSVTIDGGGFTYEYDSASSGAIAAFFGPLFQLQNIVLANTAGPCITENEHASIRFGVGVVFGNCLTALQLQSESVATFLNNFTISTNSTVSTFITAQEGSLVTFGSGITANVSAAPTYSLAMFVADHSGINMNSLAWSGSTPSGSKYALVDGAAIWGGAASIPGAGAGTVASGATVDGAAMPVSAGGSGAATFTAHGVLLGEGTGAVAPTAAGTTGKVLTGVTGADPTFQSLRQIIPITNGTVAQAQNTTVFELTIANATEANVQALCPLAGTFKNLYVQSTAPASGQTLIATLRVANADTALTCTITGTGTTCNDTTHTAACTAGQTYALKSVTSATTGSLASIAGGVEFDNP